MILYYSDKYYCFGHLVFWILPFILFARGVYTMDGSKKTTTY